MIFRLLLSIAGFIILGCLIWWIGPIVSIGQVQPLAAVWARLLLISVFALALFLPLLVRYLRNRRAEHALKAGLTQREEKTKAQRDKIENLFVEAIHTLQKNQVRRSIFQVKKGLYELPWFAFIGPPGSGKTTALRNAGLRFPLKEQLGQDVVKGVSGTRNCDWWFTDEAVLIDTAGRFTTQDADEQTDSAAWLTFLKLLKEHRPEQPINGILLTISLDDLQESSETRQALALTLARRLQEIIRTLGICPAIYVLVTKMDRIAGFNELFSRLSEDERKAGLGINFEHPNDIRQTLEQTLPDGLEQIKLELQKKVQDFLTQSVSPPYSELEKHRALGFAQEFAHFQAAFTDMLKGIFQGGNTFESALMFRGVYYTSGTQEGNAFDRILGATGQARKSNFAGKSYFIHGPLKEVIFAEQHLVGHVRKRQAIRKLLHGIAWSLALGVSAAASIAWSVSFQANKRNIDQTSAQVEKLTEKIQHLPTDPASSPLPLLNALSELEQLKPSSADQTRAGTGLNQSEKIAQGVSLVYQQGLQSSLMPRIALRLEDQLSESMDYAHGIQRHSVYQALQAYLMLYEPAHYDAKTLVQRVLPDWQQHFLKQLPVEQQSADLKHLKAAIELGSPEAVPPMNKVLVKQARQQLSSIALENRIYEIVKSDFENAGQFTIIEAAGTSAANLFKRKSGQSLNEGVSDFFTPQTYYTQVWPAIKKQTHAVLGQASWVLEGREHAPVNEQALVEKVRSLYLRDYISTWQSFINDIALKPVQTFADTVELARLMASAQSPLKKLMKAISMQTQLAGKASTFLKAGADKLASKVSSRLPGVNSGIDSSDLPETLAQNQSQRPEAIVDQSFASLNGLFTGTPPGYDQINLELNDLYTQLAALSQTKLNGDNTPAPNLNTALQQANLMPEPIGQMVAALGQSGAQQSALTQRKTLTAALRPLSEICQQTAQGRYPFSIRSSKDVLPQDFNRLFAPNGLLQNFFNSQLRDKVNTGSNTWQLITPGQSNITSSALLQFQRADRIREVLYADEGRAPHFSLRITLLKSSNPGDVFYLRQGEKITMFSLQFDPSHTVQWALSNQSAPLEIRSSNDTKGTQFEGPWALFRLFDQAQIRSTDRPEKFLATFHLGSKWFEFSVQSDSAFNPIRLAQLHHFQCPEGL